MICDSLRDMNIAQSWMFLLTACLMGGAGIFPVSAALPTLEEKEWFGYFVGVQNRAFRFGMTSAGKTAIHVLGKNADPLSRKLAIPVNFLILETLPGGKVISRQIQPESLESAQPATNKPLNIVVKGKATGDAAFEVFINEERGVISLGGHLLEPEKSKNPLRFAIELKIPSVYAEVKKNGDKKAEKAFEDRTRRDRLQLIWTDQKVVKQSLSEKVDASSKKISGPGIAAVQLELGAYEGKKIEVAVSENSFITLDNQASASLISGFSITWTADITKDPECKTRLSIRVK